MRKISDPIKASAGSEMVRVGTRFARGGTRHRPATGRQLAPRGTAKSRLRRRHPTAAAAVRAWASVPPIDVLIRCPEVEQPHARSPPTMSAPTNSGKAGVSMNPSSTASITTSAFDDHQR